MVHLFERDGSLIGDRLVNRLGWNGLKTDGKVKQLQTNLEALVDSTKKLNAAEQKEFVSGVFNAEAAAKLWWIGIGRRENLPTKEKTPLNVIAYDNPYLGYFIMMIEWAQAGGLGSRGISAAMKATQNGWPTVGGDVNGVSAAIKGLQANHDWLVKQKKGSNESYYKGWMEKFISDPKSLVNMLVIINERVCLNLNKEFKYSPKAGVRLSQLGSAYLQKFSIEVEQG